MPELTDEQIVAALVENGHDDVAEALSAKIDENAGAADEEPAPVAKSAGLGGALRRAAGG